MFAMIGENKDGTPIFTLKCDPDLAETYRGTYKSVVPGYYMDKLHWNSIYIGGDVPEDVLTNMIDMSFNLIFEKLPKKVKEKYS